MNLDTITLYALSEYLPRFFNGLVMIMSSLRRKFRIS